ncbi:formiminotetrahydrofolate cyclodeaminase [Saccharopolyspora lacisalsi]|uniref:Formiminotetrahydrofolate cyclodeaminase n=1 Tax=Halosaccharopolyspora lacisalsi TaxID=1000566 RepID=A0A839E063_9PSEU|nr:cyclodeaminase/cyclohydrolase family protein [Halosaccharopolyspora lacisalsi]MBA8825906.1 formiminotetrahydrofolate cyclodeaminase [Halosaccharopolyspora lacisalsi]
MTFDQPLREFLDEVAEPTPSVTGGGVNAVTSAAAAGLVAMTARLSPDLDDSDALAARAERLRERAGELAVADSESYAAVLAAGRRDRQDADRAAALCDALAEAAEPPLRLALLASDIAEMAADIATRIASALRGDAVTAATLAHGASRAAAALVRVNLASAGLPLDRAHEAAAAADSAERSAHTALASVNAHAG